MATAITSIRLDTHLADEGAQILGVKSRTEAVHAALREVVALKKFFSLMENGTAMVAPSSGSKSDCGRR